jgi:hypothetical protein
VHRELAQTDLLTRLLAVPWISVWPEEPLLDDGSIQDPGFEALGIGEQACILWGRIHAWFLAQMRIETWADARARITVFLPGLVTPLCCVLRGRSTP